MPTINSTPKLRPIHWVCVAIMVLQLPMVIRHLANLWSFRPHYEFFPVVIVACGWLIWSRWPREVVRPPLAAPLLCKFMLGVGLALMACAVTFSSPWLAAVAFIINGGGLILRVTGPAARRLFGPWMLCWLVIPPPLGLDNELIQLMQLITAKSVSSILEWRGIEHLLSGSVFQLEGKNLFVANACSGLHSQLLLVTAYLVISVYGNRTAMSTLMLVIAAAFWSMIGNIARVLTVAYFAAVHQIDLSHGWIHELIGFSMLLIGLLLVLSTEQFFTGAKRLLEYRDDDLEAALADTDFVRSQTARLLSIGVLTKHPILDGIWDRLIGSEKWIRYSLSHHAMGLGRSIAVPAKSMVVFLGFVGALSALQLAVTASERDTHHFFDGTNLIPISVLPKQIDHWEQVDRFTKQRSRGSDEGQYSQIWRYTSADAAVQLSVDYPFFGWHKLTDCYAGRGWTILSTHIGEVTSESRHNSQPVASDKFIEVEMLDAHGNYGLLLFNLFDSEGRMMSSQSQYWRNRVRQSPLVAAVAQGERYSDSNATTQIQLFQISDSQLSEKDRIRSRKLFSQCRERIQKATVSDTSSTGAESDA